VYELAVLKQRAGADQDVLDRAVLGTQLCGNVFEPFAGGQAPQNIVNDILIDMKLGDVMPEVLFLAVSQQLEFGLVDAQDCSIGSDPVQADVGVLKEI
jgi:hypothetical protein